MPSDTFRTRPPAATAFLGTTLIQSLIVIICAFTLTACGTTTKMPPPAIPTPPPSTAQAAPEPEPELAAPAPPKAGGASYVVRGKRYHILATAEGFREQGLGTFYSNDLHGRRTSSGEKYDRTKLTAAHKTLPMGTLVEVKNLENNKTVVVRINDRGPFSDEYVIDLSRAAAQKLGMRQSVEVSLKTAPQK